MQIKLSGSSFDLSLDGCRPLTGVGPCLRSMMKDCIFEVFIVLEAVGMLAVAGRSAARRAGRSWRR